MMSNQQFRSQDELTAKVAERIADLREAKRRGEDIGLSELLRLIEGLSDELSLEAREEWKQRTREEWKEFEPKPKPKVGPRLGFLPMEGQTKPKPETQQKSRVDVGPPETEVAQSVSAEPNGEKLDHLREIVGRINKPVEVEQKPSGTAIVSVESVVLKTEAMLGAGQCVGVGDLSELLAAMNQRHAVIGNIGGKCRISELVPSELDEGVLLPMFQSKTDFINRYANRPVGWNRRGEPLTAGEWWFNNPRRADYRGVVFEPGKPAVISRDGAGDYMNLWRGWGVIPEKGHWPLLRKHIEEVLSGGEPKMADYSIRWTAWGFQNPAELPEAALVLRGRKGAGKGLFLGTVRKIYGSHGLQITHASHLTGNFNAHLWTCAFLFADEAFWAGDKQGESVLKGLITERPAMVTKKGVDSIMTVNRVKVGMSSNSDWIVPASHDERRYAVSDVDERYAKGKAPDDVRKEYFGAIQRELAEGGAAAMLYDLLMMDLRDWHPREVPVTAGLMRQKKESLRGNFQWFEPLLQSGLLPANCGRPNRITTEALLKYVKTFRGLEYATDESIASFLYREMGFHSELSPEGNRFRTKGIGRGWEFPPLLELRERWERLFGGQWDWHNLEIDEWQSQSLMQRSVSDF